MNNDSALTGTTHARRWVWAIRVLLAQLLEAWRTAGCTCDSNQGRRPCCCWKARP